MWSWPLSTRSLASPLGWLCPDNEEWVWGAGLDHPSGEKGTDSRHGMGLQTASSLGFAVAAADTCSWNHEDNFKAMTGEWWERCRWWRWRRRRPVPFNSCWFTSYPQTVPSRLTKMQCRGCCYYLENTNEEAETQRWTHVFQVNSCIPTVNSCIPGE